MKPEIAALALSHPKKFHIGSMQVVHMTGTQGSWVILIAIVLVLLGVAAKILKS
jgi:hypothetical protein